MAYYDALKQVQVTKPSRSLHLVQTSISTKGEPWILTTKGEPQILTTKGEPQILTTKGEAQILTTKGEP